MENNSSRSIKQHILTDNVCSESTSASSTSRQQSATTLSLTYPTSGLWMQPRHPTSTSRHHSFTSPTVIQTSLSVSVSSRMGTSEPSMTQSTSNMRKQSRHRMSSSRWKSQTWPSERQTRRQRATSQQGFPYIVYIDFSRLEERCGDPHGHHIERGFETFLLLSRPQRQQTSNICTDVGSCVISEKR